MGRTDAKNERFSTSECKTSTCSHCETSPNPFVTLVLPWDKAFEFVSGPPKYIVSLFLKRPMMSLIVYIFPSLAPTMEQNPLTRTLQLTLFEPCEMATDNEWWIQLHLLASLKFSRCSKWRIFWPQLHSHHLLAPKIRNGWFRNKAPGGEGSTKIETGLSVAICIYV